MLVIFIGAIGGTPAHGIVDPFVGQIVLGRRLEFLGAWRREGISAEAADLRMKSLGGSQVF